MSNKENLGDLFTSNSTFSNNAILNVGQMAIGNNKIVFSDSSEQASAGASTGKAIAMAIVFG